MLPDLRIEELLRPLEAEMRQFQPEEASERNGRDPFVTAVQLWLKQQDKSQWVEEERSRQWQKSLGAKLGFVQQHIVGRLDGWQSNDLGLPDVESTAVGQKLIAEIKNKHNTMNSTTREGTYKKLAAFLDTDDYRGFTALVVEIQQPHKKQGGAYWAPFKPGKKPARADILQIGGRAFYALATAPAKPMPSLELGRSDVSSWPTWGAIDDMLNQFFDALGKIQGKPVPSWVKESIGRSLQN